MESGLIKEVRKEYAEAVKCYEHEITNESHAQLDTYINLAFLYWEFAFDSNIPNDIADELSMIGGNRYQIILDMGLQYYPGSLELHFWGKYFDHIICGEDFSVEDCIFLLETCKSYGSIIPYFFLYEFDNDKYLSERNAILTECVNHPTAKNLYIASIIG